MRRRAIPFLGALASLAALAGCSGGSGADADEPSESNDAGASSPAGATPTRTPRPTAAGDTPSARRSATPTAVPTGKSGWLAVHNRADRDLAFTVRVVAQPRGERAFAERLDLAAGERVVLTDVVDEAGRFELFVEFPGGQVHAAPVAFDSGVSVFVHGPTDVAVEDE